MPFKNAKQKRACYAKAAQARKAGKKPKWDCKAYGKHKGKKK